MPAIKNHGTQSITNVIKTNFVDIGQNNNIFLVGTADVSERNVLHVVKNTADASFFGNEDPAFTIPNALRMFYQTTQCNVICVNVFNPATHLTTITSESEIISNGKITTSFNIYSLTSIKSGDGVTTFVEGEDYEYTKKDGIVILDNTTMPDGDAVLVSYSYVDPTKVQSSIIGSVTSGVYTGLNMITTCLAVTGLQPNIICIPTYSKVANIASSMGIFATQLNAKTTISHVVTSNQTNDINGIIQERLGNTVGSFNVVNPRVNLIYGDRIVTSNFNGQQYITTGDVWYATLTAYAENAVSFGASVSNRYGVPGDTYGYTSILEDNSNPVVVNGQGYNNNMNLLNDNGVSCFIKVPGTNYGTTLYGSKSSASPQLDSSIAPLQFSNVQRSIDIIVRLSTSACQVLVDDTDDFNFLVQQIISIIGSVLSQSAQLKIISPTFYIAPDDELNTPASIANGILYMTITIYPNPPLYDIVLTFNVAIQIPNAA